MLLFWLFIIATVIQCLYALLIFARIFHKESTQPLAQADRKPVSIIICAKNEAENLRKNLPAVLSQDYKDGKGKVMYEVIVVNDASADDTATVLQELEQQYDNLWDVIISHDEERAFKGKKYALSRGIAHASHDWLLLTDADCLPASNQWLVQMMAPLAHGKEIVAGYGGYNKAGGLLNAFIRWETVHTFLQYSTYARTGVPYMGVGRNMACTKQILQKAQQHPVWNMLPSGDDDLLVSIAGNADNVAIVDDATAFTRSGAKATWGEWVRQKQRHLSTGKYYNRAAKLLLGAYGIAHAVMWLSFLLLLFSGFLNAILVIMAVRCVLYWVIWVVAARRLREQKLIYLFPLFDIGWLVYNFAFFPYIAWKNKTTWK